MTDDTDGAGDGDRADAAGDADRTVPERVADHAVALSTTDPGGGPAALSPLRDALADRTVVGLGEATHGSREFFQVKHRLVRLLVQECDCRAVAMEADFTAARAIDEYVTGVGGDGERDPRAALAGLQVWPWKAEGVLELVEWLRSFNEGRPPGDHVRVYGVDAQHTDAAARAVREYLDRVDPEYRERAEDALSTLAGGLEPWRDDDDDLAAALAETESVATGLRERFERRREAYVEATSPAAFAVAARQAWALERAWRLTSEVHAADDLSGWAVREQSMARTVEWVLDRESAPVALWGHNGHVMYGERDLGTDEPGLGELLADRYGDDYYALGFDFERGSFRAFAGPETDREGVGEWHVDPLSAASGDAAGTLAAGFGAVDAPAAVLDFDRAREDARLAAWLDTPHERRDVGAVFRDERQTAVDAPGERFDGLAFVRETTAARPLDDEPE